MRYRKSNLLTALALAVLLGGRFGIAAEADDSLPLEPLRIAFTQSVFTNVNRNDALAAIKVWVEAIGRRRGYHLKADTDVYESLADVRNRVADQTVDIIILDTMDYLALGVDDALQPMFVPQTQGRIVEDYIVLARGALPATLAELRQHFAGPLDKLPRVLDDLVASGDLSVQGQGRQRRYADVTRTGDPCAS